MLVFWYFLLVGGVNFVVMRSYEMPYYDGSYLPTLLMLCGKELPNYRMCNCLFPTVTVVETHTCSSQPNPVPTNLLNADRQSSVDAWNK
jgi:hypothetical protein